MRIVSLLPAATEIVHALGLGDELVGVSAACDWPPDVAGTPVLGDIAALLAAAPDLVLTGGRGSVGGPGALDPLEVAAAVRMLDGETSIVALEPTSLEGILNAISTVGAMAEAEDKAVELVGDLRERLGRVEARVLERRERGHPAVRVVALDRLDPVYAVGDWIPEQIRRAGGWDLLGVEGEGSRETSWEAVREVDPETLILMPRGCHLADGLRAWRAAPRPAFWRQIGAVQRGQVFAVDAAAYFSRPGPRLIDGIELLAELLDPGGFVDAAPLGSWSPVEGD